jgi:hypothetical protein
MDRFTVVILLLPACVWQSEVRRVEPAPAPTVADTGHEPEAPPVSPETDFLGVVGALTRASLDLRGVRPTPDEIAAVEADPAAYDALVEGFLSDPRLGARVRDLFADIYLTRQDWYYVSAADYGLGDEAGFAASVGEEPLRILAWIVENDLPYPEIVTADWTMANEHLGAAFPVDYPEGGTGWQPVRYTDGRPAAGVLSTNGMWWRYMTNASNLNRGRANAISRILLCNDYLSRPIEFDRSVNLLDAGALEDALRENPGCVACHSTLDPIASYLYGFYAVDYTSRLEMTNYHPEREQYWRSMTEVAPGFYGAPGYGLADLGQQIAADPRLPQCLTEQVYGLLLQRAVTLDDTAALTAHREALLDGGLTVRALLRSVLQDDEYRRGVAADGTFAAKMMSVDQLGTAVEALTGFRFTTSGYDLLGSDSYGVRTLAGGVDGVYATRPASEPTATAVLVQARIAQAAAWDVVEHDASTRDAPRLFTEVDFTESPQADREKMATQVQALHLRLFGERVALDGPEVTANLALWDELYALDADRRAAWAGLLSVLLRDPDFLFY